MNALTFTLQGLLVGFIASVPVGPVGVLAVRRLLMQGRRAGIMTGIGGILCDTLLVALAALSIAALADFLAAHEALFWIISGSILTSVGVRAAVTGITPTAPSASAIRDWADWQLTGSALLLGLSNPLVIMMMMALLTGLGYSPSTHSYLDILFLALGVAIGSTAWYTALCVGFARVRLTERGLLVVRHVSGYGIATFGVLLLARALFTR